MTGFFSSSALANLAPGLATYIASTDEPFRLIVSPFLRAEDIVAIEDGVAHASDFAAERLVPELVLTENVIANHAVKCLSYLLRVGRLDLRIALLKRGLFHPKVWIFERGGRTLGIHGSSNVTHAGLHLNYEQVSVAQSWKDPVQGYIVDKLSLTFRRLWDNDEDDCEVIPAPEALRRSLLKVFDGPAPTEQQLVELYGRASERSDSRKDADTSLPDASQFKIPPGLRYNDGPFAHQGEAVRAWCSGGFRGILEMATGSGKTVTSMIAAHALHEQVGSLLIVIAAPYVPLLAQWCDEVTQFGLRPVNLSDAGGSEARSRALLQVSRRLRLGVSTAEAVVVSHDALCTPEFIEAVTRVQCPRLLIADEAHNLGRATFVGLSPQCFDHRLALSATPDRQYDPDGTQALYSYFGPVAFSYTLEQAIGKCLVEYDYHIYPVQLSNEEMDRWRRLSSRIRQNAWRADDGTPDSYLTKLYNERRLLLETASEKLGTLEGLLDKHGIRGLRHALIYASDKGPAQLERVNSALNDRGILFHQLTATETADRAQTRRILEAFAKGDLQVLTAKRVLDEGVNIPQVCEAYILASTTVGRQWIQRRGRLLRTCREIGKTHGVIHDFIALPPVEDATDKDAQALVRSELKRVNEFARLARNAGRTDGPLATIRDMVDLAFLGTGGAQ
ncbi:MAG: DEAD/DEAH box helicase family protein [Nannocystaceae bacterium]